MKLQKLHKTKYYLNQVSKTESDRDRDRDRRNEKLEKQDSNRQSQGGTGMFSSTGNKATFDKLIGKKPIKIDSNANIFKNSIQIVSKDVLKVDRELQTSLQSKRKLQAPQVLNKSENTNTSKNSMYQINITQNSMNIKEINDNILASLNDEDRTDLKVKKRLTQEIKPSILAISNHEEQTHNQNTSNKISDEKNSQSQLTVKVSNKSIKTPPPGENSLFLRNQEDLQKREVEEELDKLEKLDKLADKVDSDEADADEENDDEELSNDRNDHPLPIETQIAALEKHINETSLSNSNDAHENIKSIRNKEVLDNTFLNRKSYEYKYTNFGTMKYRPIYKTTHNTISHGQNFENYHNLKEILLLKKMNNICYIRNIDTKSMFNSFSDSFNPSSIIAINTRSNEAGKRSETGKKTQAYLHSNNLDISKDTLNFEAGDVVLNVPNTNTMQGFYTRNYTNKQASGELLLSDIKSSDKANTLGTFGSRYFSHEEEEKVHRMKDYYNRLEKIGRREKEIDFSHLPSSSSYKLVEDKVKDNGIENTIDSSNFKLFKNFTSNKQLELKKKFEEQKKKEKLDREKKEMEIEKKKFEILEKQRKEIEKDLKDFFAKEKEKEKSDKNNNVNMNLKDLDKDFNMSFRSDIYDNLFEEGKSTSNLKTEQLFYKSTAKHSTANLITYLKNKRKNANIPIMTLNSIEKDKDENNTNHEVLNKYSKTEYYRCKTLSDFRVENDENEKIANNINSKALTLKELDRRQMEIDFHNNLIYSYLLKKKDKFNNKSTKVRKVFVIQDGVFVLNRDYIPGIFMEVLNKNHFSKFRKDRIKYFLDFLKKAEDELKSKTHLVSVFLISGKPVFDLYDVPENDIFIYVSSRTVFHGINFIQHKNNKELLKSLKFENLSYQRPKFRKKLIEKIFAVKKKQKLRRMKSYQNEMKQRMSIGAKRHSRLKLRRDSVAAVVGNGILNEDHKAHSFYDMNDYGEEEERFYFSDNESRKKEITVYKDYPNKYEMILYFNDISINLSKKISRYIKHKKIPDLETITNIELMDSQIRRWKGIKEKKESLEEKDNIERTKIFMMKLIKSLEIWKFEKMDVNRYDKFLIEDTKRKERKGENAVFAKNIEAVGNIYFETEKKVYKFFPCLLNLNIPKIMSDNTNVNRFKMYEIFVQYKILMKVCIALNKSLSLIKYGIDFETFYKGVPQMRSDSEELAKKIFETVNERHNNYLSWDEFLRGMTSVKSKSIADKIDMFFKVIDSDGNGLLSYSEVKELSELSLRRFFKSTGETAMEIIEDLGEYFANLIFDQVEVDKDDEIDMKKIKEKIIEGGDGAAYLEMFCCADGGRDINNNELEFFDLNRVIEFFKHKGSNN